MGAKSSYFKETTITNIDSNFIGNNFNGTKILSTPILARNKVLLLDNHPNYDYFKDILTIGNKYRIEYVWSNKYGFYKIKNVVPSDYKVPGNTIYYHDDSISSLTEAFGAAF